MGKKEKIAKIIRVATVPPVMVLVLLMILYSLHDGMFSGWGDLARSIFFLTVVPLLAYPLAYVIPKCKDKGREGQRNLAFILNLVGYTAAVIYGIAAPVSRELQFVFWVYFVSLLVLIVFNKVLRFKASGHACSIVGPLLLAVYFIGTYSVLPCLLLLGAILWSSRVLKRHTMKELALGGLSTVIAFVLCGIFTM